MARQFIYHMSGLTKVYPGAKPILNNVHLQDARFQEKISSYQDTVLSAASEVETGLVQVTAQNHEVQVIADSLPADSGFFVSQLNGTKYEESLFELLDVIDTRYRTLPAADVAAR